MKRLLMFAGGLMCGALVGATLVLLLTPTSGETVRDTAQERVDNAMGAARSAAEKRRIELEAELAAMTGAAPAKPALKK
jgi:gas vesicle protein